MWVFLLVMGIKGRRVHMIEELSETVISFQRGNPPPLTVRRSSRECLLSNRLVHNICRIKIVLNVILFNFVSIHFAFSRLISTPSSCFANFTLILNTKAPYIFMLNCMLQDCVLIIDVRFFCNAILFNNFFNIR